MKAIFTIILACCFLFLESTALAATTTAPNVIHRSRVILVENPYADQVRVNFICVYTYKDPWKGTCEKITKKHPGFFLQENEKLSDIQRIGLIGTNLLEPSTTAECLAHFDHGRDQMKRLEDSSSYIAEVNYVSGNDMVCTLLKESD